MHPLTYDMLDYISADIGGTSGTAMSVHLFCLIWVSAVLVPNFRCKPHLTKCILSQVKQSFCTVLAMF